MLQFRDRSQARSGQRVNVYLCKSNARVIISEKKLLQCSSEVYFKNLPCNLTEIQQQHDRYPHWSSRKMVRNQWAVKMLFCCFE